ncbi:LysR family transcriptional regulator [Achromobacter xylosoxidans]
MNLRLLKYFAVLADELNYRRAAERLHIEISPLSRAIQSLETTLGVSLFVRSNRGTLLTPEGEALREHIPAIFSAIGHARDSVLGVAVGNRGALHIALSEGMNPTRLATLMAGCRADEPRVVIHFSEVPFAQQLAGLDQGLYDLGFAPSDHVGRGIVAERAWQDPIHVVLPTGHPLLAMEVIPLSAVLRHPLVLGDPKYCEGCRRQIDRLISKGSAQPLVAAQVQSTYLMLSMVAAGVGLALVGASQALSSWELGILSRPLAEPAALTTWLLRSTRVARQNVARFVERVIAMREDTSPPSRAR